MIIVLFIGVFIISVIFTLLYAILTIIEVSYRELNFEKKTLHWLSGQKKNNIKHLYFFYNSTLLHVHTEDGQKSYIVIRDKYTDKITEGILGNILYHADLDIIQVTNYENCIYFLYLSLYIFIFLFFIINITGFIHKTNINHMNVKKILPQKGNIRIRDVGGLFESKNDVMEFIDIVLNPFPYITRGVSIPHGVLLEGPPGTGKTMLAKAISNEYDINFFYVSGSDFSKPLVGMGTQYVKELFAEARRNKPSILFIDEIDSIGASRDLNSRQNDEKDSILNSILTEMDGFSSNNPGFIVMAATNRVDILDKALLRPGRFDRIVKFGIPTKKERKDIIAKYIKKIPQKINVDVEKYILEETPGFSGAQIKNVINEAGMLSIKKQKNKIDISHVRDSIDYVLYGKKCDEDYMSKTELEVVAYHESGHALMGLLLKESPEVSKLTIIPRSKGMLGFVKTANQEDKRLYSKGELLAQILILMAGRAAEEVVFKENKITTGASNDIEVLNNIARKLVTQYGMNSTIGLVYTDMNEKFQKQRTEDEISKLLHVSYELTKHIITQNRTLLDKLKNDVMKQKTLEKEYFQNLKLNQRYSDTTELINNFIAKKTSTTGRN